MNRNATAKGVNLTLIDQASEYLSRAITGFGRQTRMQSGVLAVADQGQGARKPGSARWQHASKDGVSSCADHGAAME